MPAHMCWWQVCYLVCQCTATAFSHPWIASVLTDPLLSIWPALQQRDVVGQLKGWQAGKPLPLSMVIQQVGKLEAATDIVGQQPSLRVLARFSTAGHMCVRVCVHACMHARVCACMHACVHACACVCMHARVCACMRVCVHAYVCVQGAGVAC